MNALPREKPVFMDFRFPRNKSHFRDLLEIAYWRGFSAAEKLADEAQKRSVSIDRQTTLLNVLKSAGQAYDSISHAITSVTENRL